MGLTKKIKFAYISNIGIGRYVIKKQSVLVNKKLNVVSNFTSKINVITVSKNVTTP